jgi:putative ABC transport system ATP-binding protein
MGDVVLEARSLAKDYWTDSVRVPVLAGVELTVARGEFVAVMGPSGCGKSTLLYVLSGLTRPTAGEVVLAGHPTSRLSDGELTRLRQREVGFVFQRFNLLPTLSAEENLALAVTIKANGRAPLASPPELLERFGLGHRRRHRPPHLSAGEQQRVAIARAIITQPAIILADEPTGNLDSANAETVLTLFADLNRQGFTILLVTHNPDVAGEAGRVLHMRDGRFVGEASP